MLVGDEQKDRFIKNVRELMQIEYSSALRNKQVILAGTGSYARMLLDEFSHIGIKNSIVAICDMISQNGG